MVIVLAVKGFDVERDPGIDREGLKPFIHQFGVERTDLVARERRPEREVWPPRNIDGDAGQRLVHRHMDVGIAGDALHVAQCLLHRLAERDADILRGMMVVDMQVAGGLDLHPPWYDGGRYAGRRWP